jgi:hypothetical protein
MPAIGLLGTDSPESFVGSLTAIRQGLKEVGYFEGQNVVIEYRWAEGSLRVRHAGRMTGVHEVRAVLRRDLSLERLQARERAPVRE